MFKLTRNEHVQGGEIKDSEELSREPSAGTRERVTEKPGHGVRACPTASGGPTVFREREWGPLRGELSRGCLERGIRNSSA